MTGCGWLRAAFSLWWSLAVCWVPRSCSLYQPASPRLTWYSISYLYFISMSIDLRCFGLTDYIMHVQTIMLLGFLCIYSRFWISSGRSTLSCVKSHCLLVNSGWYTSIYLTSWIDMAHPILPDSAELGESCPFASSWTRSGRAIGAEWAISSSVNVDRWKMFNQAVLFTMGQTKKCLL